MATQNAANLYRAVNENNAEGLAHLLEHGANVDEFFGDSMNISFKSLLHICCGKDHVDCLRVLINNGAKLDLRDQWGQTPLMYCVFTHLPDNAKILLEASPDLCKCQDMHGKSPLHCAVEVGNIELVLMLLKFGADVNLRNHDGHTPLMTSCTRRRQDGQVDIMVLLIEHGAMIDLYDYMGKRTALHIYASAGNFKAVEILVEAGCDVNLLNKNLRTPLTDAIYFGTRSGHVQENFMKVIECLVGAGADLGMSVCESCNPLVVASQMKCPVLMKFLLLNGANPDVKFPSGITAALVSTSLCDVQALQLLISYNCDLTIQGSVYKRRFDKEMIIDPFLMALMQGSLHLCIPMILAGYPITKMWNKTETKSCLEMMDPDFEHNMINVEGYNVEEISVDELCRSKCRKSLLKWICAMSMRTRSLQAECVLVIRSVMGHSVNVNVNSLPLPKALRDAVCLNHVLEMFDEF